GHRAYKHLLVAPAAMRDRFLALIDREALNAAAGKPARIFAKVNAIVDEQIVNALYTASRAGVQIDLLTRGICCLRPGIPGVSDPRQGWTLDSGGRWRRRATEDATSAGTHRVLLGSPWGMLDQR